MVPIENRTPKQHKKRALDDENKVMPKPKINRVDTEESLDDLMLNFDGLPNLSPGAIDEIQNEVLSMGQIDHDFFDGVATNVAGNEK